ncbi:MAG TPA: GNAT family N-acetyltransferase [Candidatus Dormibacteraeota bacterium]|nr:GNAT family N-acetyltransferase [Candidatus Dormibacteraeota bacterium]
MLPSQLVELALRPWGRPLRGTIVDRTPERIVELVPSFPIPGPNHVGQVRCAPARVEALVAEVRDLAASHGLSCIWTLDPDAQPLDLSERLEACGLAFLEEVAAMVLPAHADVAPGPSGVEVVDALCDLDTFAAMEAVQAAAFGGGTAPGQAERFANGRDEPARQCFLALVDGEPAGAGWATVREEGVFMNGGSVAPRFQGQGVYRSLVGARMALARRLGLSGLATWAKPDTSGPILAWLRFFEVGRLRMHG